MLHVFVVYGIPNAAREEAAFALNEALLGKALAVAAEIGNAPVVIVGDFNIEPDSSAVLRAAMATGRWHDAAAAQAVAHGVMAPRTCFVGSSEGTRIDAIPCNSIAASALGSVGVVEDTGLPTHFPVVADFAFEEDGQWVMRIARPVAFSPGE